MASDDKFYALIGDSRKDTLNAVIAGAFGENERDTFTVGLSADGKTPATHYHCYSSLSQEGLGRIVAWVCGQLRLPIPDWMSLSDTERHQWLEINRTAIEAGFGGGTLRFHKHTDPPVDVAAILQSKGLQPLSESRP